MRYCTNCGTEYNDTVADCKDCDQPLVGKDEWDAILAERAARRDRLRDVDLAPACDVGGHIEANRLLGVLEQEGIAALLRSYEGTAFGRVLTGEKPWGQIMVAEDRLEDAITLIDAIRGSDDELGDDGDSGEE